MPFLEYFEATWLGSSGRLGQRSTPLFHHGQWNQYDAAANGGQKTNNPIEGITLSNPERGFLTPHSSSFCNSFRENKT